MTEIFSAPLPPAEASKVPVMMSAKMTSYDVIIQTLGASAGGKAAEKLLSHRGDVAPMGHQHHWDSAIFRKRVKIKFKQFRYRAEFDIVCVSN